MIILFGWRGLLFDHRFQVSVKLNYLPVFHHGQIMFCLQAESSELQILEDLRKFEATDKYTSKDMSLAMLASELNTNTKYLSKVINEHKKKNFNAYINELRVNFIVEKMKTEPSYLNYKVSYLAEVCGFSSHSTFTTVFKSIVGVSPITFVEFIREESLEKSSQTE